ncbi:phosducin [Phyllosticta citricarpa]|uniref:Phosducin n=1 Tax=Phyllosticta citricarpa TaxID=55181 RepID=A0ABR1LRM8_9PEZI
MNAAQEEFDQLFGDKSRSSRHPEDRADSDLDSDKESTREQFFEKDDYADDEDDFLDEDDPDQDFNMRSRYTIPQVRSDANTGPKGVIADAQAYEQAKKSQRFSLFTRGKNGGAKSDSEKSGSEDDFMARWRENRLRELQNGPKRIRSRSRSTTGSPSARSYGRLVAVDSDGYLEAIEKSPSATTVVVFIYDDQSEISNMVEECLATLARRHGTVKFIKFHYEDAEMNEAGVPAILAYRGGDKFAGLIPVTDEIPDDAELSDISLEVALKKYQIVF